MEISAVTPVFNEEKNLPELNERLSQSLAKVSEDYEIIYVDDGSYDGTYDELTKIASSNPKVKYLKLSRNFGHQIALTAGLNYVNSKAVVLIDGDLQDPPELIPELYQKYQEGYRVVYAKRRVRKGEHFLKSWTASLFYNLMARITSVKIPVNVGDYRLIDRKVLEKLRQMPESHKFLRGQIAWLGFRQTEVEFDRLERKEGKTGYTISKLFSLALDGITSFSNVPLRLASFFGFVVSFIAFLIILYALYSKYILEEVITGWTSLIISTMFIGGIQLIFLGVLGEYVSRINDEVKHRPLYVVEDSNFDKSGSSSTKKVHS